MSGIISSVSPFGVSSVFNAAFVARGPAPVLATGLGAFRADTPATRVSPRVSPLWRPEAGKVQTASATRSGGFLDSGIKAVRSTTESGSHATTGANIVSGPLLELRSKAKTFPKGKAAYASHKKLLLRLDPDRDIYVNVYNQPDNEPAVVVNISVTLDEALKMGLFEIQEDEKDGKQSVVLAQGAREKIYIELGHEDISFSEMENIGEVFSFPIQIPLAALPRVKNGNYSFVIRVGDQAYPFEAGRYSHDRVGF